MAGGQNRKCPYCERGPYQDTRSLKKHMSDKHKDEADYQEKYKSVPKSPGKPCPTGCGKMLKNLYQKHACKGVKQSNPQEGENEFIQEFREWLVSPLGNNCAYKTRDAYSCQVRKFIAFEKGKDVGFCPWNWLRWGQPGYVVIRDCREFLVLSNSNDTQKMMSIAYSKLTEWIGQHISEARDTPWDQFMRHKTNNAMLLKQLKKGKTFQNVAAEEEGAEEQGARHLQQSRNPAGAHLDPAITRRLMIAWDDSYSRLRKGALKAIRKGDFNIPDLKISTEEGVRSFMSLTLYLKNYGIRTDVLRNMTLGELKEATNPAERCIYCNKTVRDYGEHKRHCLEREKFTFGQGDDQGGYTRENLGVDYQDYDSGSEIGKCPTWTIRVRKQKTQNTGVAFVSVIVDDLEYRALRALVARGVDNRVKPFQSIQWEKHMRPIMERMVKLVGKDDLWKAANPPGKPLGSYEFKRLWAQDVADKGEPDGARSAIAVGTSKAMLEGTYDPREEVERARAEQLRRAEAERKRVRRAEAEHLRQAEAERKRARRAEAEQLRQVEDGRAWAEQLKQCNPSTQHQGRHNNGLMEDQGPSSLGANMESTFESNKPLQEPDSDSDTEDNVQALMEAARKLQFNPTNNSQQQQTVENRGSQDGSSSDSDFEFHDAQTPAQMRDDRDLAEALDLDNRCSE